MFETISQLDGLKCMKLPMFAQRIGGGVLRQISSWCDFILVHHSGRVAFVDTKSIYSDSYNYSLINQDQVDFLRSVGDYSPAGYVICFRTVAEVRFFSWEQLQAVQPNTSLHYSQGRSLGNLGMFHPKLIFDLQTLK